MSRKCVDSAIHHWHNLGTRKVSLPNDTLQSFTDLILNIRYKPGIIGGNQREVDRQRSQKRAEKSGKKKKTAGNASQALTNKKEHDAEIMRQKQVLAEQKKAKSGSKDTGSK